MIPETDLERSRPTNIQAHSHQPMIPETDLER